MTFFKKKIKAYEVGKILYLMMLDLLFRPESPVNLNSLISSSELEEKVELNKYYQIEAIIALIYQTLIIIYNNFEQEILEKVY
jgi:hypothetical protein